MEARESWRNVGGRIRYLRKLNQLTLKQLAAGSGMSTNAISLVERGEVAPTIATLCRIAAALGVTASSFLREICPNELHLVRAEERHIDHVSQAAFSAVSCPADFSRQTAQGSTKPATAESILSKPVQQTVMCLSGKLEYQSEGQTCQLMPGDSLTFNARAQHTWTNSGTGSAVAVMILPCQTQTFTTGDRD